MTKAEKRWILIYSLVMMAITSLPYLMGFWLQGSQWRFTGFFIGVEDGNSYIAKMLIGSAGNWLFRTPYTAFQQNGFMAFLPYLLLGKLVSGAGLHEQLVGLFQLFRWAGVWVMVYATYRFIGFFVDDLRWRKLGTGIATIGGGFGWLAFVGVQGIWGGRIPLEAYSPETFGFLSLFTLPHLAMARGILLLGLLRYWQGYTEELTPRRLITNSLLWIALGLMQPFTVLIGWMVLGLDVVVRWIRSRNNQLLSGNWRPAMINAGVMLVSSAPIVIYTAISFFTDPFLKAWSAQNIIMSPPPSDYLLAYGITIPFLYFGFKHLFQGRRVEGYVLAVWIILFPVLAYFPYNLQRRLPEGIWVALVIVTVLGASTLRGNWARIGRFFLYTSFLTSFLLMLGSVLSVLQIKAPIYRPNGETAAFQYIHDHADDFPVVLAAYDTSNALPAWAPVHTLIGHGPESIHLKEIQPRAEAFYQPVTSNQDRLDLIREFKIRYVFWGPLERQLGDWDPDSWPRLSSVYQNGDYQVFEVLP
jgi:hypothetical protein